MNYDSVTSPKETNLFPDCFSRFTFIKVSTESIIIYAVGTDNDYVNKTHKLLPPLKIHLAAFDDILCLVVALRKLAMPAASGVPCVNSTFYHVC